VTRLVLVLGLLAAPGEASAGASGEIVWQARSCVGEIGWNDLDTCTAMTLVHQRRARRLGWPLVRMIRTYSRPVRPTARRRWVLQLNRRGAQPADWPEEADWSNFRGRWLRVLSHVRDVLGGQVPDPCPGALHYGGATIDPPGPRMVRHACLPRSGQAFYTVRRR
jgi:hypothetical protein